MECEQGHRMILKTVHSGFVDAEDYICPICGCEGRLWETGEMQQLGEGNGKDKEHNN